jgi:hypothetical protein
MSVKEIRANIQAAISQLHEARVKWERTPTHRKYLEISDLMIKVDEQYVQLKVLDMHAADTLRQVLQREGKNPNSVR